MLIATAKAIPTFSLVERFIRASLVCHARAVGIMARDSCKDRYGPLEYFAEQASPLSYRPGRNSHALATQGSSDSPLRGIVFGNVSCTLFGHRGCAAACKQIFERLCASLNNCL